MASFDTQDLVSFGTNNKLRTLPSFFMRTSEQLENVIKANENATLNATSTSPTKAAGKAAGKSASHSSSASASTSQQTENEGVAKENPEGRVGNSTSESNDAPILDYQSPPVTNAMQEANGIRESQFASVLNLNGDGNEKKDNALQFDLIDMSGGPPDALRGSHSKSGPLEFTEKNAIAEEEGLPSAFSHHQPQHPYNQRSFTNLNSDDFLPTENLSGNSQRSNSSGEASFSSDEDDEEEWLRKKRSQASAGGVGAAIGVLNIKDWYFKMIVGRVTNKYNSVPKSKTVEKIIRCSWQNQGAGCQTIFAFLFKRPIFTEPIVALKSSIIVLKLLQNGPPEALTHLQSKISILQEMINAWTKTVDNTETSSESLQPLIQHSLRFLVQKIHFHTSHPIYKLNYVVNPGQKYCMSSIHAGDLATSETPCVNTLSFLLQLQHSIIGVIEIGFRLFQKRVTDGTTKVIKSKSVTEPKTNPMDAASLSAEPKDLLVYVLLPYLREAELLHGVCSRLFSLLLASEKMKTLTSASLDSLNSLKSSFLTQKKKIQALLDECRSNSSFSHLFSPFSLPRDEITGIDENNRRTKVAYGEFDPFAQPEDGKGFNPRVEVQDLLSLNDFSSGNLPVSLSDKFDMDLRKDDVVAMDALRRRAEGLAEAKKVALAASMAAAAAAAAFSPSNEINPSSSSSSTASLSNLKVHLSFSSNSTDFQSTSNSVAETKSEETSGIGLEQTYKAGSPVIPTRTGNLTPVENLSPNSGSPVNKPWPRTLPNEQAVSLSTSPAPLQSSAEFHNFFANRAQEKANNNADFAAPIPQTGEYHKQTNQLPYFQNQPFQQYQFQNVVDNQQLYPKQFTQANYTPSQQVAPQKNAYLQPMNHFAPVVQNQLPSQFNYNIPQGQNLLMQQHQQQQFKQQMLQQQQILQQQQQQQQVQQNQLPQDLSYLYTPKQPRDQFYSRTTPLPQDGTPFFQQQHQAITLIPQERQLKPVNQREIMQMQNMQEKNKAQEQIMLIQQQAAERLEASRFADLLAGSPWKPETRRGGRPMNQASPSISPTRSPSPSPSPTPMPVASLAPGPTVIPPLNLPKPVKPVPDRNNVGVSTPSQEESILVPKPEPIPEPKPNPSPETPASWNLSGSLSDIKAWTTVKNPAKEKEKETENISSSNKEFSLEEQWEIPLHELKFGPKIGQGAFGDVLSATWQGTQVAVKRLPNLAGASFQQAAADFRREVSLVMRLRHPNVILFMGACTGHDELCLVMEYAANGSLYHVLRNPHISINYPTVLRWALEASRGMNYLHTRSPAIVHRDLKSVNLLVDADWHIKVSDFGLALTKANSFAHTQVGTWGWMAPEVLASSPYNEKVDVYSFGVVLWELYTREEPFKGYHPMQIMKAIESGKRPPLPDNCPLLYRQLVEDCWRDDPSSRPTFEQIIIRIEEMERTLKM